MRWRTAMNPGTVLLAALGVLTVVLLVLAIQKQAALSTPSETTPAPAAVIGPPSVAFIGDSFTSGTPDGGLGPTNYTALLASREGWRVTDAAVDGAGYVAAPLGGGPFAAQESRVVAAAPELVVVVGARPDQDVPPADVRTAADGLYRGLQAQLPRTRIVVVGPIWPGGNAPDSMRQVRDSVRDAAGAARLRFVDPIEGGWFSASDDPGLAPDGTHLNEVGHQGLANLVGDGLQLTGASPG